jgi:hypothetical protein
VEEGQKVGVKYVPPNVGMMHMQVVDDVALKAMYKVLYFPFLSIFFSKGCRILYLFSRF